MHAFTSPRSPPSCFPTGIDNGRTRSISPAPSSSSTKLGATAEFPSSTLRPRRRTGIAPRYRSAKTLRSPPSARMALTRRPASYTRESPVRHTQYRPSACAFLTFTARGKTGGPHIQVSSRCLRSGSRAANRLKSSATENRSAISFISVTPSKRSTEPSASSAPMPRCSMSVPAKARRYVGLPKS